MATEGNNLRIFQIIFDSPVFYSGQNISGRLLVEFTRPELIKGIQINYLGQGVVRWRSDDKKLKVHFKNVKPFLNEQQFVFGSDKGEYQELAAGQRTFSFNYELQSNLPCSYKGQFGRLKYRVKAIIDTGSKTEYVIEQPITILSLFDLNCLPLAAAPVSEKKCAIFWKETTPVHMNVNLPVRGFVPGQVIPIKVTIMAESFKVQTKSISATLYQSVLFRANRHKRHVKVRLCGTEVHIENGFGLQEALLRIQVPAVPPSYLEFCEIMDIRYILHVKGKVDTFPHDIDIDTEILIGNIPLMKYEKPISTSQMSFEPVQSDYYSDSHSLSPSNASLPHLALHGDFLQPIYRQMMGTEKEPDLLYPVYSFPDTGSETGKTVV